MSRAVYSPPQVVPPRRSGRSFSAIVTRHYGIAVAVLKENLAFRFQFFTSLIMTIIMIVLVQYLWSAVYRNSSDIDMTFEALITYVCIAQAMSLTRMGAAQRRTSYTAADQIANGNVILDLVRPVDFQLRNFSGAFGQFVVEMLIVSIPAYLFCLFVVGISLPPSIGAGIGFIVSLFIAFLLAFTLDYLIIILSFWTLTTYGLMIARKALVDILSGSLIPIALFPGWLKEIASVLPFRGMASIPLSIYVGEIEGSAISRALAEQLIWVAIMFLLTRLIWHLGSRKLVIQGG